jgi:DNA polymerase-1
MIYYITPQLSIQDSRIQYCTEAQANKYLSTQQVLQVDTETTGLSFVDDTLLTLQVGTKDHQFVFDLRHKPELPLMKQLLESGNRKKLLHNCTFDYKFLKKYGIRLRNVHDTMVIEKVITNGKDTPPGYYGLGGTLNRYTGEYMSKEMQMSFVGHEGEFSVAQIIYAAKDVEHLEEIRQKQLKDAEEQGLLKCVQLENAAVLAFGDIEYNGMLVDKDKWLALAETKLTEALALQEDMNQMILDDELFSEFKPESYQVSMFDDAETSRLNSIKINWSSPHQTTPIVQKMVPSLESSDTKILSAKHRNAHPLIPKFIEFKEKYKKATAFGPEWIRKYVDSDGKVHTSFTQIIRTGRVSSSRPNMQQIPADNAYRNCFIAEDGWSYVSSDFSSQELCIIAFASQDPVWLDALEKGQDLHSVCADLVYGQEWAAAAESDCAYMAGKEKCDCKGHKKLRTAVKGINFGLAYGMGPHKLSDTLDIPIEEAEALIDKYFSVFPSIKNFLDTNGKFGKTNGYIRTMAPYKRIRRFPLWAGPATEPRDMGSIDRMSRNTPIQGAAGDMTKEAMCRIRQVIMDAEDEIKMVMVVHDQIDFIVRDDKLDKWTPFITEQMELAGKTIVQNGLLKSDTTTAKCWEK